jgi:hypothetical protein
MLVRRLKFKGKRFYKNGSLKKEEIRCHKLKKMEYIHVDCPLQETEEKVDRRYNDNKFDSRRKER